MSAAPFPLEPDDQRRARHLFVLKSLADRAYTLAMKAADQAEVQLDATDPASGDDTPSAPAPKASTPRAPNLHQAFERHVRVVHLLVNLEHRIATAGTATRRNYRSANGADMAKRFGQGADPRRPQLQHFLQRATRNSPERAALRRAAIASLDEALDRDPARTLAPAAILYEICQEYGLPFDIAHLPDEFLVPPVTGPP